MDKIKQFFNVYFRQTLLLIAFFELLSWFIYYLKPVFNLNDIIFSIVMIGLLIIAFYKIEWGIYIGLVELFIGSKGYLYSTTIFNFNLSIRIVIFSILMLATAFLIIRRNLWKQLLNIFKKNREIFLVAAMFIVGIVLALINANQKTNIFLDANNWLYFIYFVPLLLFLNKSEHLIKISQLFVASLIAISIKSLIFLYFLSHNVSFIKEFYKWGRDTGFGEFVLISGNLFRVFSQSQIYLLLGLLIVLSIKWFAGKNFIISHKFHNFYLILVLSGIFLSMSRSFWVAGSSVGLLMLVTGLIYWKMRLIDSFKNVLSFIVLTVISYGLILSVMYFPLPNPGNLAGAGDLLSERLVSNEAVGSRWNQITPLKDAILKSPFVGSGWGREVTYPSQDPRIMNENNPSGMYTTFTFEWGYLDLLLKVGMVGLFCYLGFIFLIFMKFWLLFKKTNDAGIRAIIAGLNFGLLSLLIVHIFTPYINHPLGIGYMLIMLVFLNVLLAEDSANEFGLTIDKISGA